MVASPHATFRLLASCRP
uniref:Uncharacterized protein n=1 Tax=Arundo donax TaxID=35708 RepID=A0A0A9FUD6_ARUDO